MKKTLRTKIGPIAATGFELTEEQLAMAVGGVSAGGIGGGGGYVFTATLSVDGSVDVAYDHVSKQP